MLHNVEIYKNSLSIGIITSGYIFQFKVDKLHGNIDGEKYFYYIMVLNKGMFSSHEDQIIYFKTDIFKSGLKVNDNKYNSRFNTTPSNYIY